MAVWMLHLAMVGGVVGAAGLLAERGLRRLGRPVRWAWVAAMIATVGLPFGLAVVGSGAGSVAGSGVGGLVEPIWRGVPDWLATSTADTVLLTAWVGSSLVLLTSLRLSAWTLRRNERSWRVGRVAGERTLVSAGFGPGVIGASRPRMVLPEWVLDAAPSLRRLVVLHELEHVRAGDTRLLLAGVIAVTLVPWCLPLWWQLHRLRGAIETDCDVRVLAGVAEAGEYAHVLVEIAGRRTRGFQPVPALAPRRAELERRIHLITGVRERSRLAGAGLIAAALLVLVGLGAVPAPAPPTLGLDVRFSLRQRPPVELPREATVILRVEPGTTPTPEPSGDEAVAF